MSARLGGRLARRLAVLSLLIVVSAPAYYHFVRFEDGRRRLERFDIESLVDSKVFFYVSTAERPLLQSNDSLEAVLSRVREALRVWDSAPTSALRVGFGGVVEGSVPGEAPAGEIVFAELPPGVLGLGGPVIRGVAADGSPAIVRSQVLLANRLVGGARPRTSFSELFFSTLVHEIGHALGLQHTLAASAMSTDVIRATTHARPLAADDIAGLSLLYPTADFAQRTGAVSGRVLFSDGRPVALASVAAMHPTGEIVTALSDPDGRYRIEGLAPGRHLLWVQPLPPSTQEGLGPANIVLPAGAAAAQRSSSPFRAAFLGGGRSPNESRRIRIAAGSRSDGADFRVEPRAGMALSNITTYTFPGNNAPGVHPAFLDLTQAAGFALATGPGLADSAGLLTLESLGRDLRIVPPGPYERDGRFLRLDFAADPFAPPGAVNLLFALPDDFYVLPSAVQLTSQGAPVIHWLVRDFASDSDAWLLWGSNLDPGSQVFFDGEPARVPAFDAARGEIRLQPPPAAAGHRAVITVYNPDGQSSAFTLPDGNVIFEYPAGPDAGFELSAPGVRPGEDVVVEVRGRNLGFEPGRVMVGVGSSDVVVRRINVVGPNRARAVLSVLPGAAAGEYSVTVVSGLQTLVRPAAFVVGEAGLSPQAAPRLSFGALVNSATGGTQISPFALVSLFGERLSAGVSGQVRVTFNGLPARLLAVTPGQINLVVPPGLKPGVAELIVFDGRARSDPMLVEVDRVSPGLFGLALDDIRFDAKAPLPADGRFELLATGLGAPGGSPSVQALVGGLRFPPSRVRADGRAGLWRVQVDVPVELFADQAVVSVSLLVDGRRSNTLRIPPPKAPRPFGARAADVSSSVD